ncbi:ADP-ribose diphosphatase [Lentibacillus sp. JNUCC-1]|uniref:NUDIX domain-containing protein n=1 Tax=Lentibacillus sp. JNUCC-1 TaxID=2654513 RepID=UPI0012E8D07D|nr:NUDIX hydrolase [Lentibacillus sp. JNUCC-1]MUV39715.1 ADP-ribose diphosphatase [Lentibacillus sp. JNUCC-1]
MKKFEEKTLDSQSIYDGKIIKVHVDDVRLPDGNTAKRERVEHSGAVAVIPITEEGKIVFVEQYRKPLEKSIIEIPAGKLEQDEAPEKTAVRELEEETGYTTHELEYVASFYTSPGFADELMHIYLAKNIIKLEETIAGDDDEFIDIIEMTLEEAEKCVKEERIHDAKTNYAVLYLASLNWPHLNKRS